MFKNGLTKLLEWFLSCAWWCGVSLKAIPAFWLVPHYQQCLLMNHMPVIIGHACWSIVTATNILLAKCRWKKDSYKSGATLTEVSLHQTCLLIRCHSQICMHVQCYSIKQGKASDLSQIHQTCLQAGCSSHRFENFVGYHPGCHLEYIKFRMMHK